MSDRFLVADFGDSGDIILIDARRVRRSICDETTTGDGAGRLLVAICDGATAMVLLALLVTLCD